MSENAPETDIRVSGYVEWVDRVLQTVHGLTAGDSSAAIVGVGMPQLQAALALQKAGADALRSALRDLDSLGCTDSDNWRTTLSVQGHRAAEAGGMRAGWKSLFDRYSPLEADRAVATKLVEMGLTAGDGFYWVNQVEMKEALGALGQPNDQGAAIVVTKRLESVGCIHPDPLITMGADGYCRVIPTYVAIVVATQRVATDQQAMLRELVQQWETTSVDFKELLELNSDRQKAEFCKDILALANTRTSGRGFIVVGFNDSTRAFTSPPSPAVDAHKMESVLAAYCAPVPLIRYSTVPMPEGAAGLIEVLDDPPRLPYKLSRDVWKLRAGSVFVRHNTLVAVADGEELEALVGIGRRARGETG